MDTNDAVIPGGLTYYPVLTDTTVTHNAATLTIQAGAEIHWDTSGNAGTVTLSVSEDVVNDGLMRVDASSGEARLLIDWDFTNSATGSVTRAVGASRLVMEFDQTIVNGVITLDAPISDGTFRINKPVGYNVTFLNAANSYDSVEVVSGTLELQAQTHSLSGNVSVSGGTLVLGGSDTTISGDVSITGGTVDHTLSGYALKVGGNWSRTAGTYTTDADSVVEFVGAGSRTVGPESGFQDATFGDGNGGDSTISGSVTVNGTLTIETLLGTPHALNGGSGAILTMGSAAVWDNGGNPGYFDPQTGTVVWQSANAIPDEAFYDIDIETTVLVSHLGTALDVLNDLAINAGGIASSANIQIGGSWANNVGEAGFDESLSTVRFTDEPGGSASQITTGETFNNLIIGDTDGATVDSTSLTGAITLVVLGTLELDDAAGLSTSTLDAGANTTIELGAAGAPGTFTIDPNGVFAPGSGSALVRYFGGAIVDTNTGAGNDYINLEFAGTSVGGLPGTGATIQVAADFTVSTSSTFSPQAATADTVNVGDDLVLSGIGTFADNDSAWVFNGTSALDDQELSGAMAFALGEGLGQLEVNKTAGSLLLQRNLTVECNLAVPGTVTVVEGELDLNGFQLICEGGMTVQSGGTLSVVNGALLDLGDTAPSAFAGNVDVQVGGTFRASGTSGVGSPSEVRLNGAAPRFSFNVYGDINVTRLVFNGADTNGLHIIVNDTASNLVNLNGITFGDPDPSVAPTRALQLTGAASVGSFSRTFTNHTYEFSYLPGGEPVSPTYNATFSIPDDISAPVRTITMDSTAGNWAGSSVGEANDDDSDNPDPPDGQPDNSVVNWIDPTIWHDTAAPGPFDSDWHNAGNWSAGVPTSALSVRIPAAADRDSTKLNYELDPVISVANAAGLTIQLQGASTLTLSPSLVLSIHGEFALDVAPSSTFDGQGSFSAGNASTVEFIGTNLDQTIPIGDIDGVAGEEVTYAKLRLANGGVKSFSGAGGPNVIEGSVTVETGTTLAGASSGTQSISVYGNWTLNGTSSFSPAISELRFVNAINGQTLISDTASKTFAFNDVSVENTAGNGMHAELPAGTTATLSLTGDFTVIDGAQFNAGDTALHAAAVPVSVNLEGNWTLNGSGTFVPTTSGTVTFSDSTAIQTIASDNTLGKTFRFNNLTSNNSSLGGLQLSVALAGVATLDIDGNFNVPVGQVMDLNDQAGGESVRVQVAGNLDWGGSVTEADSLVVLDGTGNQTIETAATFNFLELNRPSETAGTSVTASGNLIITGADNDLGALGDNSLSVVAGTLDLGTGLSHQAQNAAGTRVIAVDNDIDDAVDGTLNVNLSTLTTDTNVLVNHFGTLAMAGNATNRGRLRMAQTAFRTLAIEGTLRVTNTEASPSPNPARIEAFDNLFENYGFTVGDGDAITLAELDINALEIQGALTDDLGTDVGLLIRADTRFTRFDQVTFTALCDGSIGAVWDGFSIYIQNEGAQGNINCNNCSFDASMTYNADANGINGTFEMTFIDFSSANADTNYEENDLNDKLTWLRTLRWTAGQQVAPAAPRDWSEPDNWSPAVTPGSSDECIIDAAAGYPDRPYLDVSSTVRRVEVQERSIKGTAYDLSFEVLGNDLTVLGDFELGPENNAGSPTVGMTAAADLRLRGSWINDNPNEGLDQQATGGTIFLMGTGTANTIGSTGDPATGNYGFRGLTIDGVEDTPDVNAEYRLADGASVHIVPGGAFSVLTNLTYNATFRGGPVVGSNLTPAVMTFWANADGTSPAVWNHTSTTAFDPDNSRIVFLGGTALSPRDLPENNGGGHVQRSLLRPRPRRRDGNDQRHNDP